MARLEAITPKGQVFNSAAFLKEWTNALNDTAKGMKADYERTTKTWKHKVKFTTTKPHPTGGAYEVTVSTDDKIYSYVDLGTRAHNIRPKKRGGVLRFKTGYIARTIPRVLSSGKSSYRGGWMSAKGVRHPGTQARRFSFIIQLKWQDEFQKRMKLATEKAAKG